MQNKTSRNIIGPDVNEYRGDINYTLLATQTPYCYLRGSGYGTGRFRIDKKFIEYAEGMRNVGILTGAYHYAVPSADLTNADTQCDEFIDALEQAYGPKKYGDLFPVIDVEAPVDKSISTDILLDWVDRFRKRFERKTRRKLMLYTGSFFIELYNNFYHTKKGFILSDMPLWIAMYVDIPSNPPYPMDQGGWTRWRMWQFTENGTMPGINNPPVDLNYGPENLDLLTQPRNVKNFSAVPINQEIRLSWDANTDVDLGGYNIFISANYVTTLNKKATSYILKLANRPVEGERYEVSIEAFDNDGEFSQERSRARVTFVRQSIMDYDEGASNKVFQDINSNDYNAPVNINHRKKGKFKDPVDFLEKKFIVPCNLQNTEDYNRYSNDIHRNNKLYDDFVEFDNEFDDDMYMRRLESEKAYQNYYGNREYENRLEGLNSNDEAYNWDKNCMESKEKEGCNCCNCNKMKQGYQNHHHIGVLEHKCECDKDGIHKTIKDIEDIEDIKDKKYEFKPSFKDEHDGERRRLENHDSKKLEKCNICLQDKDNCINCEHLHHDMYLNNCDYGHENSYEKKNKHDDKKYKDYYEKYNNEYPAKKKKKKHHKKH